MFVGLIGRANPQLEAMGVMPAWTGPVASSWESFAILAALRHRAATGHTRCCMRASGAACRATAARRTSRRRCPACSRRGRG